ncbi:NADH-quinone oxidoreductase subunit NuoN [Cellulomonas marina]|uniref:NADH-quinone oxidoreductase subunit N n=1 Tax=Cellulomonas marina TaxID=988821 RepID=A0A1I0XM59_9CELL|nr:NADH-quinone oxidoreductase subunit NuoN [Cellulomonas marina]GIG30109.1 NADH-quinone oxidoreductase subunit N [Cellulomonas marina]SFB01390.1 NADH-quinone oxidoreductase subunit N [Cellulomonas marina]
MNGFTAPEVAWGALSPVLVVLGAAVVGVLVEAFVPARARRLVQVVLALLALLGALVAVGLLWGGVERTGGTAVLGGSLVVDGPALVCQAVVAVLALLSLLVLADRTRAGQGAIAPSVATVPGSEAERLAREKGLQQTEVYPLVLFATGGMLVFPAAGDLLTLFVALEVLSLPLYLLSGTARERRLLSQEASLKYFLLGAFASAVLLFGVALLYGYSGSLRYADIAAATATPSPLDGLLVLGSVLVLVGLLFKVGAMPFHSWTPDVYQGAPTPVTAFMAACTKVAAVGALLRFVYVVVPGLQWDLAPVLWGVAIVTMVAATVVAMVQTDVKRMLGYSSVAHAGFLLTGVVALDERGVSGTLFYLLAYGVATVGAFAVVSLVRQGRSGGAQLEAADLSAWDGLARRSPVLALAFSVFLLSFAGIPLTGGFLGKFSVFSAAVDGGAWPLALVGVLASAAAAYFYVRVIVRMYFTPPADEALPADEVLLVDDATAGSPSDAATGTGATALGTAGTGTLVAARPAATRTAVATSQGLTAVTVVVCLIGTVLLGVLPQPVLDLVGSAAVFLP